MASVVSQCPKPGLLIDLAVLVLQVAGIPAENQSLVPLHQSEYGRKLKNGSWEGVLAKIEDGTVDISIPLFTVTSERSQIVRFTETVLWDRIVLVTELKGRGKHRDKGLNAFGVFQPAVWGVVVLLGLLICLIQQSLLRRRDRITWGRGVVDFADKVLCVLLHFTGQTVIRITAKPVICFWVWPLCSVIFGGLFAALVLGNMLRLRSSVPF